MRQIQNNKNRTLYFPQRVRSATEKTYDYPLIIVEAPMGYGKTTAVREYVKKMPGVNFLWQNIYDESKAFFWSDFCRLFRELDNDCAHKLEQLGFPDDSVSIYTALQLIKSISFSKQTVIVIDDFHLVDTQEMTNFFVLLATKEIENLHIVLISRFFEFLNVEELSLKGYLYHIKKETFAFNREETMEYYECCGISLTADEADELFKLTEGWISALYLLMLNYKEGESFLTSTNIYKLVEQAVYNPFPEQIKDFLLSMSIYSSFTLEQASAMMPDVDIGEIIEEVTSGNAFVMYDHIREAYYIHSILRNFLSNKLKTMGGAFHTVCYKKAAEWYMQTGDYLLSMRYSYLGGDFDTLLRSLELDKGKSIFGEHRELLVKYFNACSMEVKARHPYAVLIYARRMFSFYDLSLFQASCKMFMTIYESFEIEDPTVKNRLLGEYELLMSLSEYNAIEKMAEYFRRAYRLLKEPSLILDRQSVLTYGSPSVLYLFYRQSGELLNEVRIMQETMPYYTQITDNHGKGADEVMSAERFYYIGDFQNAEIAMYKAYQLAAEASDIMCCTIFLNIKLCFMKGDFAAILALFQKLRGDSFEKRRHLFLHTIDICEAYVYCSLHMDEKLAFWIKSGEFKSVRLPFPSFSYLNIVYGRVLLMNGEYAKLLGMTEQFLSMACAAPNLLGQIYTHIYSASANAHLSRTNEALAALERALCIAMPDQLYMPFAENGDMLNPLLVKLQKQNVYADDIAEILTLHKQYQDAAKHMIKATPPSGETTLTERENQVAQLAAQGLSNKEIAKRLYISENTVKAQLKSVFAKLGINSRALLK